MRPDMASRRQATRDSIADLLTDYMAELTNLEAQIADLTSQRAALQADRDRVIAALKELSAANQALDREIQS